MNEASSKLVDSIAIGKLMSEKLAKVSHSHLNSFFTDCDIPFNYMKECKINMSEAKSIDKNGLSCFMLPSFFQSRPYPENNMVNIYHQPAKNAEGNVLFLHGLFDDNLMNYGFLFKLLNELNLNVFFMVLPYHFDRKPEMSLFGGEYFFSADVYRTRNAYKQAVYDIEVSMQFINAYNKLPSMLVGFSMGGNIAARYYLLKEADIKLFLVNPVSDLTRLVWDNPLLLTVGKDLKNNKFDMDIFDRIFKELDPCENINSSFEAKKVAMIYSIYDQIIDKVKYKSFIERMRIKNVYMYSSGHLNILRVPKLSRNIYGFFKPGTA